MELYIGGAAQGKLSYVLAARKLKMQDVADGRDFSLELFENIKILNHFESYVRRVMEAGRDPETAAGLLAEHNPELIVISDEIGGGIIPCDPFERAWRENTGRILCSYAAQAVHFERIICGVGQILK